MVVRLFYLKLKRLLDEVKGGQVFGPIKGYCASVEFQDLGLPHAHILITLESEEGVLRFCRKPSTVPTSGESQRFHQADDSYFNPYLVKR